MEEALGFNSDLVHRKAKGSGLGCYWCLANVTTNSLLLTYQNSYSFIVYMTRHLWVKSGNTCNSLHYTNAALLLIDVFFRGPALPGW